MKFPGRDGLRTLEYVEKHDERTVRNLHEALVRCWLELTEWTRKQVTDLGNCICEMTSM